MRLVIPPVYERMKEDGFDSTNLDVFKRKGFADNLTNLFRGTDSGLVLTVNSQWGDGKTSFIKIWEKDLEDDDQFIPIYYDAFSNDFTEDVFLSIAVEIHRRFEEEITNAGRDPRNDEQLKKLKQESKKIVTEFLKMITGSGIKALFGGLAPGKEISEMLFDTLMLDTDEKFSAHLNFKKTVKGYQAQLKEMLTHIDKDNPKKIVFFVDELDRCRPDFAIEVLEKIKHLYNIPNVYFVLAINKSQLRRTIENAYGVNTDDSEKYLEKFVHLETILPPINTGDKEIRNKEGVLPAFIQSLIDLHQWDTCFVKDDLLALAISNLITPFNPAIPPRTIERVFTLISVALVSSPTMFADKEFEVRVLCAMALAKICLPKKTYDEWKKGTIIQRHGIDDELNTGRFFSTLQRFFEENLEKTHNSRFTVPYIAEVCEIIDVYSSFNVHFAEVKVPSPIIKSEFGVVS